MTCQDCIAKATDYLDRTLSPLERARHASHIERCPTCARYHRVLERGLVLARGVAEIQPSPGFRVRLNGRLRGLENERRRRERAAAGAAMVLAVAGLIALSAWAPIWQESLQTRRSSAMALRSDPVPGLPPAESSWDWWYVGLGEWGAVNRVSATFPGPYSPLVVQPPVLTGGASNRTALVNYGDSE
jgi:hypothetical protein